MRTKSQLGAQACWLFGAGWVTHKVEGLRGMIGGPPTAQQFLGLLFAGLYHESKVTT